MSAFFRASKRLYLGVLAHIDIFRNGTELTERGSLPAPGSTQNPLCHILYRFVLDSNNNVNDEHTLCTHPLLAPPPPGVIGHVGML
jgi:hypothetical protein